MFYKVRSVQVSLAGATIDMALAHNFDHVPPNPFVGRSRAWKKGTAPEALKPDDWHHV